MPFAFKVFIGVILMIVTLALMGHYQVSVSVSFDTLFHIGILIILILGIRGINSSLLLIGKNQRKIFDLLTEIEKNVIK